VAPAWWRRDKAAIYWRIPPFEDETANGPPYNKEPGVGVVPSSV